MGKIELEKNTLDLSYKRNLQLLNIILIVGLSSFVAYLAAFLLNPEKIRVYTILLFGIAFVTYAVYYAIDRNLRNISREIRKLAR